MNIIYDKATNLCDTKRLLIECFCGCNIYELHYSKNAQFIYLEQIGLNKLIAFTQDQFEQFLESINCGKNIKMNTAYENQLLKMSIEEDSVVNIQLLEKKTRYKPIFDFDLTLEQRNELINYIKLSEE